MISGFSRGSETEDIRTKTQCMYSYCTCYNFTKFSISSLVRGEAEPIHHLITIIMIIH